MPWLLRVVFPPGLLKHYLNSVKMDAVTLLIISFKCMTSSIFFHIKKLSRVSTMQDLLLSKYGFSFCCFRPEPQQKAPLVPPPPPPPPPPPLPDPTPPEPEEEILGSDDEEQEDPADYCKGAVLAFPLSHHIICFGEWTRGG